MEFARYVPTHEVDARHRAFARTSPREAASKRAPAQRNVQAVLDLGDVRAISFQGHAYLIPPVPFKLGERVSNTFTHTMTGAKKVAMTGDAAAMQEYYKDLSRLARLMWSHIRPAQRWRRVLRRLGLLRNPFLRASEKDLQTVSDFFLKCRMTSSVRFLPTTMDL